MVLEWSISNTTMALVFCRHVTSFIDSKGKQEKIRTWCWLELCDVWDVLAPWTQMFSSLRSDPKVSQQVKCRHCVYVQVSVMLPVGASPGCYLDVTSYMTDDMAIQWHETFNLIRTQRICPRVGLACSLWAFHLLLKFWLT